MVHLEGVVPLPLPRGRRLLGAAAGAVGTRGPGRGPAGPAGRPLLRAGGAGAGGPGLPAARRRRRARPSPGSRSRPTRRSTPARRSPPRQGAPALFNVPPGFAFLQAAWSALSAAPAAARRPRRDRKRRSANGSEIASLAAGRSSWHWRSLTGAAAEAPRSEITLVLKDYLELVEKGDAVQKERQRRESSREAPVAEVVSQRVRVVAGGRGHGRGDGRATRSSSRGSPGGRSSCR